MQDSNPVCRTTGVQPLIDAMSEAVAVVSKDGTIACVNRAWRVFSDQNGGDRSGHYVGENYLRICRKSAEAGSELAAHIEVGLSEVLDRGTGFHTEYPCHGPSEKRWFEVVITPFDLDGTRLALVVHRNITTEKLRQFEAINTEQNAKNLAAIVATMPDAVIAFDLEGRITSWNAAARKLYGYDRDEVLGQSMELLYPPGWPKSIKSYIVDIVARELRHFEVTRQTKSGTLRTIAVTAAPVRSLSGDIIGVSNVHRDVTEKRQAEHRLRSILDNLFAFVGVLELDGTLVEANRAPLEAAGLDASAVLGKKFWECYWWTHDADVQARLQHACARAREGEVARYDVQVQVAGGQLIWLDFQLAPMRDADGEIVNLIPSGIDISERKAMVQVLKASHDTFQNLVAQSPFGVYTVDADFRLAHVSAGAQPVFENIRPLIGHEFSGVLKTLWPEPFSSEAIERFRHTLATGEPYRAPSTIERRQDSGEVESYDWMIERITMPDGRPGVVCNFYDLSERQRYEEHVHLLMREVNHRAKNLLTVVMSMARQTARDCPPDEFVDRFSQRLFGLSASQDLIVQSNWGGVGARDLASSQLKHLGEEILHSRVALDGPDLVLSPAAAQGIGMALHELSTNALKYGSLSTPDGAISIDWGINGDDTFRIGWTEHDGPRVTPPVSSGFGRTVIERMAAISVGGSVDLQYDPAGVRWVLTAPVEQVVM